MDSTRKIPLPLYSYRKHADLPDLENPNFEEKQGLGNIVPRPRAQVYGELPGYQAPQFLVRSHTTNSQRQTILGRTKNKPDENNKTNNEPGDLPGKLAEKSTSSGEELDKSSSQSSNSEAKALANQDNPNEAVNSERQKEEGNLESDLGKSSNDVKDPKTDRSGWPTSNATTSNTTDVNAHSFKTARKPRRGYDKIINVEGQLKNDPKRIKFFSASKHTEKRLATDIEKSLVFAKKNKTCSRNLKSSPFARRQIQNHL